MGPIRTVVAIALTVTAWVAVSQRLGASDELERAKELYRSAAYDEAVAILDHLGPPVDQQEATEIHAYRVFCLVALDRRDEAERAMAALVTASPSYVMSELEASPRVRAMFTEVRREMLPSIVQAAYTDAKAAFDAKDPGALAKFDHVLTLLKDPDVQDNASLRDLTVVATGFRDLSKVLATPPAPVVAAPTTTASSSPAPAPPPPAPAVVPPVTLTQMVPTPQLREEREWHGEIEVVIDGTGKVTSARMTVPIHPVYDQQLTRAALAWTYRPALRNGVAEEYVKRIPVHIDTRPECTARSVDACRPAAN